MRGGVLLIGVGLGSGFTFGTVQTLSGERIDTFLGDIEPVGGR